MTRLSINGFGLTSRVIIKNSSRPDLDASGIRSIMSCITPLYPDNALINGASELEASNNSTLIVTESDLPLKHLIVNDGGIIILNNIFIGNNETIVTVGENSQMILTGENMNLSKVILAARSNFSFMHYGTQFRIDTKLLSADLVIPNIHQLVALCGFLSKQDFDTTRPKLPLSQTHSLRLYLQNKEAMDIIFEQNNIAQPYGLARYINTHLFEIYGISKIIINTPFVDF